MTFLTFHEIISVRNNLRTIIILSVTSTRFCELVAYLELISHISKIFALSYLSTLIVVIISLNIKNVLALKHMIATLVFYFI